MCSCPCSAQPTKQAACIRVHRGGERLGRCADAAACLIGCLDKPEFSESASHRACLAQGGKPGWKSECRKSRARVIWRFGPLSGLKSMLGWVILGGKSKPHASSSFHSSGSRRIHKMMRRNLAPFLVPGCRRSERSQQPDPDSVQWVSSCGVHECASTPCSPSHLI